VLLNELQDGQEPEIELLCHGAEKRQFLSRMPYDLVPNGSLVLEAGGFRAGGTWIDAQNKRHANTFLKKTLSREQADPLPLA
jgi:hypothetical protein